jgi:hypothetical protein
MWINCTEKNTEISLRKWINDRNFSYKDIQIVSVTSVLCIDDIDTYFV